MSTIVEPPADNARQARPIDPLQGFLAGGRVHIDRYLIRPTSRTDRASCLEIVAVGAGLWVIRQPGHRGKALNRQGRWVLEQRNHRSNRARRYPLPEALSIALWHVDRLAATEEASA